MSDYAPPPLTAADLGAVLAFLPVFEAPDFRPSSVTAPPGQFPYHVWHPQVEAFVGTLHRTGFVFPFDWPAWQDEAARLYEVPERLAEADLLTLRKLLTLHLRQDRFSEGHLPAMIAEGHVAAILRRLAALVRAGDGGR